MENTKVGKNYQDWFRNNKIVAVAKSITKMSPTDRKLVSLIEQSNFTGDLNPVRDLIRQMFLDDSMPSESGFTDRYINQHKDALEKKWRNSSALKYWDVSFNNYLKSVIARIKRTYISQITEIQAQALISESMPNYDIYKTIFLDSRKGIDFVIDTGNIKYGIQVYVGTPEAVSQHQRKYARRFREPAEGYTIIEQPYSIDSSSKSYGYKLDNGIIMCDKGFVNSLKKKMSNVV
jgi:hypothetical protein